MDRRLRFLCMVAVLVLSILAPGESNAAASAPVFDPATPGPWWTIWAGPVEKTRTYARHGGVFIYTGTKVKGTFKVGSPRAGIDSIPTDGYGGACLVANTGPKHCQDESECNNKTMELNGESGYCLSERPEGHKRCWIRPAPISEFCNKHPPPWVVPNSQPLQEGVVYQITGTYFETAPPSADSELDKVKWLVHACLNGRVPVDTDPPCSIGDWTNAIIDNGRAK